MACFASHPISSISFLLSFSLPFLFSRLCLLHPLQSGCWCGSCALLGVNGDSKLRSAFGRSLALIAGRLGVGLWVPHPISHHDQPAQRRQDHARQTTKGNSWLSHQTILRRWQKGEHLCLRPPMQSWDPRVSIQDPESWVPMSVGNANWAARENEQGKLILSSEKRIGVVRLQFFYSFVTTKDNNLCTWCTYFKHC